MKTLTVNVPTNGKVIIVSPKKRVDNAQLDLFETYRSHWIEQYVSLIRSMRKPVTMSMVRMEAAKRGMAAPANSNWYGIAVRAAGLRCIGAVKSPLKSRKGGWQGIWE